MVAGKPLPPEPRIPWWVRAAWWVQTTATWPFEVRKLKREGFRRIGWRTWEYNGGANG